MSRRPISAAPAFKRHDPVRQKSSKRMGTVVVTFEATVNSPSRAMVAFSDQPRPDVIPLSDLEIVA
jgi:hypothetical protein